jgi:hypothetical protein
VLGRIPDLDHAKAILGLARDVYVSPIRGLRADLTIDSI